MRNLVAAIDLGTTKVVCLVGEKTAAGIKIIAMSEAPSKGVNRGEVVNIQSVLDSMMPTIHEVEGAIGEKINEVFTGIAGQYIKCTQGTDQTERENPDELITQEEIDKITGKMYEGNCRHDEVVLHAIPQSYIIDNFMGETKPVGMSGKQIFSNFKLFIGKKISAQHKKNVIARGGLKLKELILEPVASAKAVLDEEEMEIGVALLDIGGGTTDLLIIKDNIVRHAAVIPFGGNSITDDLKQGCGVSHRVAEQLKTDHGSCISTLAQDKRVRIPGVGGREDREISLRLIAGIIEARVEEILEAAAWEIEQSGYKDQIKSGIVITGGSSQLANLKQIANTITGMPVRLACPDRMFNDGEVHVNNPALSTAVGLIIAGFEHLGKTGAKNNSTTPIDYGTKEEKPKAEENKEQPKAAAPATEKVEKKKDPVNWGNFWKKVSGKDMFNENEA